MNAKVNRAWIVFDWANSAYSLVIVSTIFPQVFNALVAKNPVFLGINFGNSEALYTYSICFSYLLLAIISPILSGISDYSGKKKRFMQFFTILGSLSCMGLYFFNEENTWIGVVGAILASIGFSGSLVFYNAFLPEITPKSNQDKLSAKGFAYGYLGSSLLLIVLLSIVSQYQLFGFSSELKVFQFGFVLVGLWWLGWSQWTFAVLPENIPKHKPNNNYLKSGFNELKKVWSQLKTLPRLKHFLRAFFMVDLGLQTLLIVAPLFAINVVKMNGAELIVVVLLMQFLGIAGAVFFSRLSINKGSVISLMIATMVYVLICLLAVLYTDKNIFYFLAALMGFALGGIQSQSRSAYSKLLPNTNDTASFFNFFDIVEKIAIVLGTFIYAGINYYFADKTSEFAPKIGILILGVFFMIGLFLWLPLKKEILLKNQQQ